MRKQAERWAVIVLAAMVVAAGPIGCGRTSSVVSGLKKKKDQNTIGGDDVMSRLGAPASRAEAAREIGEQKLSSAVPPLLGYLQDKDPNVRLNCVWALGEIGDANVIADVRSLLTDHERKVRLQAAITLGKLPGAEGVFWLGESMSKDPAVEVRVEAVKALAELRQPSAAEWLTRALGDGSMSIRITAARGLVSMPGASAETGLMAALVHEEKAIRDIALPAVKAMGKAALPKLSAVLDERVSMPVRLEIAKMATEAGGAESGPVLIKLLDTLGPKALNMAGAPELKKAVVDAVSALGPGMLGELRRVAIEGESNPLMEQAAMEICRRLGKPAVKVIVESILRFKVSPSPEELRQWIGVLGDVGEPEALPALNRALAQGAGGMEAVVADARGKIEAKSGTKLAAPAADHDMLIGKPGPGATRQIERPPLAITPNLPRGGDVPDDGVLRLFLRTALTNAQNKPVADLEVNMVRQGGQWQERFWCVAPTFNKRDHPGRVIRHRRDGDKHVLNVEILVNSDTYVQGGFVEYELTIAPGNEELTGTYNGHMNYTDNAGTLDGASWSHPADGAKASPPLAEGEHPRLLFRRHHLPVLREKAKTEFGRRIISELRKRLEAGKADYRTQLDWVSNWEPGCNTAIVHSFLGTLFDDPSHFGRAAILVEQRSRLGPYGGEHGERIPGPLFFYPYAADLTFDHLNKEQKDLVVDNCRRKFIGWTLDRGPMGIMAVGRGLAGLPGNHALLALGLKAPFEMEAPTIPAPVHTLEAPKLAADRTGVPVNAFTQSASPTRWIVAGPFPVGEDDPLASVGGREGAQPQEGTGVKVKGREVAFEALIPTAVSDIPGVTDGRKSFNLAGGSRNARFYLYCLVDVPEDTGTGLVLSHELLGRDSSEAWIDGLRSPEGTIVFLGKGLHRVLVEARDQLASVYFVPVDAGRAKAKGKRFERDVQEFQELKKRYDQTGVIQEMPIKIDQIKSSVRNNTLQAIADIRQGGGASSDGINFPFVSAHWTATGGGLWPDTPLLLAALKHLITSPKIDGRHLAFAMGMVPDDLKPYVVYEFKRRFLDDPDGFRQMSNLDLVAAFVNYPLDVKPLDPSDLAARVQVDRETGTYSFLGEPVTAVVNLHTGKPRERSRLLPQAGSFYFADLRNRWLYEHPSSGANNVVEVEGCNGEGFGKLLYEDLRKDGSGFLGADTSGGCGPGAKAERHYAVDMSGKSGSAFLMAVVDRVKSPGRKLWQVCSPMGGQGVVRSCDGRTFRITGRQGANMAMDGVLVGPPGMTMMWEPEARGHKPSWHHRLYGVSEQAEADFVSVMTVGDKPVKFDVKGEGLSVVIAVGGQEVRFDGKKIVLKE
jgi:HEAT repeat protein